MEIIEDVPPEINIKIREQEIIDKAIPSLNSIAAHKKTKRSIATLPEIPE
jgi:hypothetical protein